MEYKVYKIRTISMRNSLRIEMKRLYTGNNNKFDEHVLNCHPKLFHNFKLENYGLYFDRTYYVHSFIRSGIIL